MITAISYSTTMDHMSNRLQHDSIPPIPLIDDYNPYYPYPDYGFDPYKDANSCNQHLFCFHKDDKHTQEMEPDSHETDRALNMGLANARVFHGNTNVNPLTNQLLLS